MKGLLQRFQTLTLLPDWVLVKEAQMGEKEAFGKLYEKYLDRLYRYIFYRVGQQTHVAEDIVQTVFVKAWEKLSQFRKGSFQAWLYTIARNTIIDTQRTHKLHVTLSEEIQDEKESIEEHIEKKLGVEQVMRELAFLTEEQQEVIFLRCINELSYSEIAATLGKREDAIRALQYRALKELKRRLTNE